MSRSERSKISFSTQARNYEVFEYLIKEFIFEEGVSRKFVEKIEGDYDTVVGLSVSLTKKLIEEALKND